MARLISELIYKISADATEFNKALDKANSVTKDLTKNLDKTGKALTIGLTAPLLAAGGAAIKLASDLQDSTNAVNVIFKDGASVILEYGKTAAESAGLSQAAFNEVAAASGVLLAQTGKDLQDVAKDTVDLTQRAADLASLFGGSTVDAANALGAALRGESEPARRYGVLLSEAAIAAKALELGVGDASGALTEAEKIQIRYNLIMEQSATASGDFANTNGDVKNSAEVLKAQIQNFAASLGTELLPIVADVLQDLRGFVSGFNELDSGSKKAILAFAGVAAAIGPMLLAVSKAITGYQQLSVAIKSVELAKFISPAGLAAAAVAGIAIATVSAVNQTRAWREEWNKLQDALAGKANIEDTNAELEKQIGLINQNNQRLQEIQQEYNRLGNSQTRAAQNSRLALNSEKRRLEQELALAEQRKTQLQAITEEYAANQRAQQASADAQREAYEKELADQAAVAERIAARQEQERKAAQDRIEQIEAQKIAEAELEQERQRDSEITLQRIQDEELLRQQVNADEFNRRRQIEAEAQANHDAELARIEEERQAKIETATFIYDQLKGLSDLLFENEIANIEQSGLSEKQKAVEVAKIRRKQAAVDKAQAVTEIAINTASAIIKALASLGPIAGGIAGTAIGLLGGAQAAAVLAQPLPAIPSFATGVKNFVVPDGFPNDSFPIRVQSGERVTVETPQQQASGSGGQIVLHIGTLVADDAGLRELERRMQQVSLNIGG